MENHDNFYMESERIGLRLPTQDDVPLLLRWFNDSTVLQFIASTLPKTESEEQKWVERVLASEHDYVFVIVLKEGARPIGTVGLHDIDWRNRRASIGMVIGAKDCWEQRYGTETARLIGAFAFGTLNLHKLCSGVLASNPRSHQLQLAAGGKEEGRLRDQYFVDGAYVDEIKIAFFQEDWRARQ